MSQPQILDSAGNRLQVGDRVERHWVSGATGGIPGEIDAIEANGFVWVTWNKRTRLRSYFITRRRFTPHRSYRCPDLILIPTKEDD